MAGRFLWLLQPWEDLFDADILGDGPQAHPFTDEGTPMRFAHLQYGTKRADMGITVRIGGVDVDVTNLWAAKGTAVYINTTAVPGEVAVVNEGSPPSATATVAVTFNRNGAVTFTPNSYPTTNFVLNPSATVGDGYRVRFRLLGRSTNGTLSGTFDAFQQVNVARSVSMSITVTTAVFVMVWAEIAIDVQRVSDGVTVHTYNVRLEAEAGIT